MHLGFEHTYLINKKPPKRLQENTFTSSDWTTAEGGYGGKFAHGKDNI